jgi:hypothetical protein
MQDKPWYWNPFLHQLAHYILHNAEYKTVNFSIRIGRGYKEVTLKKGELLFGRNEWAKKFKQKPTTVYSRLLKLKRYGFCDIKSNNQYSVISVTNWRHWQGENDRQTDNQLTTNRQPTDNQLTHVKNTNNHKHPNNSKTTTEPSSSFLKNYESLKFRPGSIFANENPEEFEVQISKYNLDDVQYHISGLEKQYPTMMGVKKSAMALLIAQLKKGRVVEYMTIAEKKKKARDAQNKTIQEKSKEQARIDDARHEEELRSDEEIYQKALKDEQLVKNTEALLREDKKNCNAEQYQARFKYKLIGLYKKKVRPPHK